MKKLAIMMVAALLLSGSVAWAAEEVDLQAQVKALQARVVQLEAQQSEQQVSERTAELVRKMVSNMAETQRHTAANTGLTAGYDKRFFIKSPDDQFLLEFDTRFQFRHSYYLTDEHKKDLTKEGIRTADGVDSSGNAFELERAKVFLRGHVLKDLEYRIQLESDDDDDDNTMLQEYELAYSFMPELGIKVGRYKSAFGRQENTSSGRLMLLDRSLANEVFNISRGTGVEVFGALPVADTKLHYRAGVFNGFDDEGSSPLSNNDNNPAVAARLELPLLGATMADFKNESDLMFHDNAVMQLGTSFAYANATNENHLAGGLDDNYEVLVKGGDSKTNIVEAGGEVTLFGADVALKYQGLSVILEGFYQHADLDEGAVGFENDFADNFIGSRLDVFGLSGHEYDNYGWTAQAGYFLVPKTFELVSRVSGVCVDGSNDSYEYAGGWNWYFAGQDLKLSMDVTYIDELPLVSSTPNYDGVQNNSLFLIRSQLQFQF
jgi:Phosphate-selective porin O and P